ncbi:VWA domain-containing protein [Pendulispora brunnea]|uniref:VWA domain-containing protein n=1 Tax=Pendulispora brunnea TaxID=2905690 RepID=A0ABZ2KMF1_9BACT
MRRIAMKVMGVLLLAGVNLAACGSDESTFGNGSGDGNGNGDGGGPGNGGGFGDGGVGGDGGGNLGQCATGESGTTRLPVYLDVILDGSRSMDGHGTPTTAVPCDDNPPPASGAATCFLKGRRQTDPEASGRTDRVCHDESQSINDCPAYRGLTGKKWIAARGALKAYFASQAQSSKLAIGLYLFSSTAPGTIGFDAMTAAQKKALQDKIAPGVWPSGGTPLYEAFTGSSGRDGGELARLANFQPKAPLEGGGKRVILLMTDGVPNPTSGSDSAATQAKIKDAVSKAVPNITTFVVGIGDPTDDPLVYDEKFLSQLAKVGGAAPDTCTADWDGANPGNTKPCHYQVTPGAKTADQIQNEIKAAIDNVALSLQSCELPLQNVSPGLDPNKVNVLYTPTGQPERLVKQNEGWTLDGARTKVTLTGQACNNLKADPGAKVRVIIGCATVVN